MNTIRTKSGAIINLNNKLTPSVVVSADQRITLLGEDVVSMVVKSAEPIGFEIGDNIDVYGKTYTLNQLPALKKTAARKFEYNLIFEGVQYELIDAQWLLPSDFSLDSFTSDLSGFLNILVNNANRVFPGKWAKGIVPGDTEFKTFAFLEKNCLEVLQEICGEYGTEFEITQSSGVRTINIKKAGVTFPYLFKYGRTGGLYELTRQNIDAKNVVTRLYAYGGSNNLGRNYRNAKLCLPLKEKNASFIENTASVEAFGVKENTKVFDKIYPNRVGEVSLAGTKYYSFIDNTMNFDLNEKETDGTTTKWLIKGVAAKIKLKTGNLAGYEFEVHKYIDEKKEIQVVPFTDENGMKFPSETSAAFQFAVGDKYIFTDINLPDAYKIEAETKLQAQAEEYYLQYCQPQVQYGLSIDQNFIKQFAGELTIVNLFAVGDYIQVEDADIGLDKSIRITAFTRDLLQPYKYNITLGDSVKQSLITRIISDLGEIGTAIKINDLMDPSRARRNWRSAQEVLASVFDPEGNYYSEKIKPLSIETTMLAVGAKSMQFILQNTLIEANHEGNKNAIKVTGGTLIHYTIEESLRAWNLSSATTALLSDSAVYYIYGRCLKKGTAGSIIFSTTQIEVNEDDLFYHFIIGVVNSVDSGVRSLSLTYGATTINGKFIRTGKIESSDGKTYFDLDNNVIGGKIRFLNNDGELEDIEKIKLYLQYSADAANWHDTYVSTDRYMRQKNGANGAWSSAMAIGGDGRGISHIKNAFTYSASKTSPNPNQGWVYDISTVTRPAGYFLWMRDDIFYTDGTDNSTDGRLVVEGKDGDDAIAPIIIDGYWAFWNKAQNKYIKSEFSAIGDDGYSPKIVDGYWHEWDPTANPPGYRDTGIKAEGKDGKDGETPTLKYKKALTKPQTPSNNQYGLDWNGNWAIEPDIPNIEEYSVSNWVYEEGYYTCEEIANGDNSHSKIKFTTTKANQTLFVNAKIEGYPSLDYLYISELDSYQDASTNNYKYRLSKGMGGEAIYSIDVNQAGNHHIHISLYRKSGSVKVEAKFKILEVNNLWMSQQNRTGGTWSEPIMFIQDNKDSESVFFRSKVEEVPIIGNSEKYQDDYIPNAYLDSQYKGKHNIVDNYSIADVVSSGGIKKIAIAPNKNKPLTDTEYWADVPMWTDNPTGIDSIYKFEYISERKKEGGVWGQFIPPTLWARAGDKGKDGVVDEEMLAKYDQALAITDKFGATIDGGLVTAVTMLLREANTLKNTAGISGIQGAQNEKPAFWAGGSHAEALAGLANIIFQHDGSGKVGNMHLKDNKFSSKDGRVEIDGATNTISLKDPNLEVKTIIHPNEIANIEDYFKTGGAYNVDLSSLNTTRLISTVSKGLHIGGSQTAAHELTISGFTIEAIANMTPSAEENEHVVSATQAWLLRDGEPFILLCEAEAIAYGSGGSKTAESGMATRTITVLGGRTYELSIAHSALTQEDIYAEVFGTVSGLGMMTTGKIINRSEIGSNGMVIATSSLNYTYDVGTLFQIRRGNIGFQVTSSNVKKSTDMYATTPTWTNI